MADVKTQSKPQSKLELLQKLISAKDNDAKKSSLCAQDLESISILRQLWGDSPPLLPPTPSRTHASLSAGEGSAEKKQIFGVFAGATSPLTASGSASFGAYPNFGYTTNGIVPGDTYSTRTGAAIRMHRYHARITYDCAPGQVYNWPIRFLVVYDRSVYAQAKINGQISSTADLRQSITLCSALDNQIASLGNVIVGDRYEILHDKIVNCSPKAANSDAKTPSPNAAGGGCHEISIDLKGRKTVWYDDGATDIVQGALYIFVYTDTAGSGCPSVYGMDSLTYFDS